VYNYFEAVAEICDYDVISSVIGTATPYEAVNQYAQIAFSDWLSFVSLIVVIIGAFAGLYKYFKEKNREIYEKLLSEVYAPLFQYFVKQEFFREINRNGITTDYKATPVFEVTSRTTKTTWSDGKVSQTNSDPIPVLELNREVFLSVLDSINIGLAPKNLLTLLNMYKVTVYISKGNDKISEPYLKSAILQVEIENKLRKEIISGYKKYHKKLGLNSGESLDEITITDDNITFDMPVCEQEKDELKKKIEKNPELYY
jgi:hypothetical protein